MEQTIPTWPLQRSEQLRLIAHLSSIGTQTVTLYLERLTSFLQRLLKAASDAHHFAHALHLQSQLTITARELVKIPAWYFHNHIIERRFKKRRSRFRNLVLQFIQVISNGKLGSNFRNRITGCFAGQSRRARYTRIDFNGNDIFLLVGAHRKLHVTPTGKIADSTHHANSHIAHFLIRGIRKRHSGCNRNTIARMNTNWIKILN